MDPKEFLEYVASRTDHDWKYDARWQGIKRTYSAAEVMRLRGLFNHSDCRLSAKGSAILWKLLNEEAPVCTFGALTGSQAVQMVNAGLKAIYVSGWQVAADMNLAGETYPDMSLYPSNSVPTLVRRINKALQRESERKRLSCKAGVDWFVPIIADAEAGFGGLPHTAELIKWMIEAGAAAIHLEDQRAATKKCGHLGGKVLVPVKEFIEKLVAARLMADVMETPLVIIARTDAEKAQFLTNDFDDRDKPFLTGNQTPDGFYEVAGGLEMAVMRALAYAPYADVLWCETATPDLDDAKYFSEKVHEKYPGKILAYNCSPSFNWMQYFAKKYQLDVDDPKDSVRLRSLLKEFQDKLGKIGYKFQFITLAGWHLINYYTWRFAKDYLQRGMAAYAEFQESEFEARQEGYDAVRHQEAVGTAYFDEMLDIISGGSSSLKAMEGSTEEQQFKTPT